jgi:hypothetical protein
MRIDDRQLQVEVTIAPAKSTQRGRGRESGSMVPEPAPIVRLARLMALAIKFQGMVERGEVRDYADLARLGYVTRARITQIMNLLYLAPDIQEEILCLDGQSINNAHIAERKIRVIIKIVSWARQRQAWSEFKCGMAAD